MKDNESSTIELTTSRISLARRAFDVVAPRSTPVNLWEISCESPIEFEVKSNIRLLKREKSALSIYLTNSRIQSPQNGDGSKCVTKY